MLENESQKMNCEHVAVGDAFGDQLDVPEVISRPYLYIPQAGQVSLLNIQIILSYGGWAINPYGDDLDIFCRSLNFM